MTKARRCYCTKRRAVESALLFVRWRLSVLVTVGYVSLYTPGFTSGGLVPPPEASCLRALQPDGPWKLRWLGVGTPRRRRHLHSLVLFAAISTTDHRDPDIRRQTLQLLRCCLSPPEDHFERAGGMARQTRRSESHSTHRCCGGEFYARLAPGADCTRVPLKRSTETHLPGGGTRVLAERRRCARVQFAPRIHFL
uniref:Uncharacterized protein n=1 Tax=Ixodes ricinus TaxID=34613 RepID=A0A6B0V200_IXORI